MALCSVLVVAFSCVLKVGSLPTTNTVVPPTPTSTLPVDVILDSPYHHGQAPPKNPHQHHGSPSSHNHHVNKTLASLQSLMHHLLDKDESHATPVVQSFTDCVNNCMHPKHTPDPSDDADEVGHDRHGSHNGDPDVHSHPKQSPNNPDVPDTHGDHKARPNVHVNTERNSDDGSDDDSTDVLSKIDELLRESHYHASPNGPPNPPGGHLDDDISRYWMCSHACFGNVIG